VNSWREIFAPFLFFRNRPKLKMAGGWFFSAHIITATAGKEFN
jgi:hypothetical protein